MERRTQLRRKTPLRAKTSLSRTTRIRQRSKKGAIEALSLRPTDFGIHALIRSGGLCECGCGKSLRGKLDDHHVFFRAHVSRGVRHEFWNRALILQRCHTAIHDHGDLVRRRRTERAAVERLKGSLSRSELAVLIASIPPGATDPGATVRSYEQMRRTQPIKEAA